MITFVYHDVDSGQPPTVSVFTMASKNPRPTDEDLLAQLGALGGEEDDLAKKESKSSTTTASESTSAEADLFPELAVPERQRPGSRPHTPRIPSSATTQSSKRTGVNTPPSNDGARSSEEKARPRKSGESTRSFHTSFTPAAENEVDRDAENPKTTAGEAPQGQSSGGGWWGGIFGAASAAVKQAEALAKEIQHNEEAQRWAEQVKGNVGALRGLGTANPTANRQLTVKH